MEKILIILSCFYVVLAVPVENFYRTWNQVAFYPHGHNETRCNQFTFEKDPSSNDCKCAGKEKLTLVKCSVVIRERSHDTKIGSNALPVVMVDTPYHDHPGVNISCWCGGKHYTSASVVRSLNPDHFVMYEEAQEPGHTDVKVKGAVVFAKHVPTFAELNNMLHKIVELKDVDITGKCASDL